jgi:methyl-accepting chemotaxis protein
VAVREKRKKIWIDRFQTSLFFRITFFFAFYQLAVWILVLIERRMVASLEELLGAAAATTWFIFLVVVVAVVGLVFIWDTVKFAHRVVGPLYRFRKTVQAITSGEEVPLITLRKDDFLQEMREDFNEMLRVLEQRGAVVLKAPQAKKDQNQHQPA